MRLTPFSSQWRFFASADSVQFTGCAFCLKRSGGQLHAAHVSPSNMPLVGAVRGPTTLAQQLAGLDGAVTGGDFTGAGGVDPFRVYGAGYSNLPGLGTGYPLKQNPGDYMVIVGLLSGGSWAFHSQHVMEYRRIAAAVRFTYS